MTTKKTCFKITDKDLRAHNGFQYTPLQRAEVEVYTGELCTEGVLHAYKTAEDAVFFDPIHGEFFCAPGARLWRCACDGPEVFDGTKLGVGNLTLIEEVPIPTMTLEQRVERGIRAALSVCADPFFVEWAEKWLSGEDRSADAAARAAEAAGGAWAAEAPAYAARAAEARSAAWATWATEAYAARAVAYAARALARAAEAAARALARAEAGS
jgi:hypothetical protein